MNEILDEISKNGDFLKIVIDSLPHPFYVIDPADHSIILANSASGVEGKTTCYQIAHRSDSPCLGTEHPCPLEEVKKTKKPFVTEHVHYDKEGIPRQYEVHGVPILDQDGSLKYMIEYSIDISDRLKHHEALVRSEATLRAMYEQAPIGIVVLDLKGNVIRVSGAWLDIFGMNSVDDALNFNFFAGPIIPEDKKQELMQGNPIEYESPFDFSWVHAANSWECSRTGVVHLKTSITPLKFGDESRIEQYLVLVQDVTKRKQAEVSLKRSEERYRSLIDVLPEGVVVVDNQNMIMMANKAMGEILDIDSIELIGRDLMDFVDPRFVSQVKSQTRRRTSGISSAYNIRMLRADGKPRDVHVSVIPQLDDQKEVVGAIGVVSDITVQKNMEKDLRTTSYKLQKRLIEIKAVSGASDLMKNPDTALEIILKELLPIICAGFQFPEITCARIGVDEHEFSSSNYKNSVATLSEEILVFGKSVGILEIGYLDQQPESDEGPFLQEEVSMISQISDDLSQFIERQRTLYEVTQQSAKLNAVTQSTLDAIIMINQEELVQFWNPSAERMFGYSEKETVGKNLHKMITPSNFMAAHHEGFEQFQKTGTGVAIGKILELTGLRRNGLEFPIELSLTSIKMGEGWGAVGIVRDISERKQNEQMRLLQQKELEIYISLLQHDLNNDLAGIVGALEVVNMVMNDDLAEAQQFLDSSLALTSRMGNLLRAVSRTAKFQDEPIDDMLREVATLSADTKIGLEIQVIVDDELDVEQISQGRLLPMVFENLFRNAVQHAGETPKITVEISAIENQVRIIVSDNGPGVPEDMRARLFQRGISTKESGGLGLHISRQIIEAVGGSIELMPKIKGTGAQFEIVLPLSQ